jgi:hypothetical protein
MAGSALKLLAEDGEGLAVIAAAVQDSLVKPQDLKFDARSRTFGLEINRFQWEKAGRRAPYFRAHAILAFGGVLAARSRDLPKGIDALMGVLDIRFTPGTEPPAGVLNMIFAGGGQVELDLECLDVTLMDTGKTWPTRRKPDHEKPV